MKLVREFIHDSLYHATEGYFCKKNHQLGQICRPLVYRNLEGAQSYRDLLGANYPENAFLTPVEIFQPWYGYSIAYYMLKHAKESNIKIIEIGSGTGTGALSILDFFKKNHKQTYDKIQYYACEISPVLSNVADTRLYDSHSQLMKNGQVKVVKGSIMDWDTPFNDQVFIIGLEILDNFPHDRVYADSQGKWSYQAMVTPDGQEIRETIQDPYIQKLVEIYESLPPPTDDEREAQYKEGFIYNILKYWYSKKSADNIFLPTGAYIMMNHLYSIMPQACFILADFDQLPHTTINGINAPIVSTKGKEPDAKVDYDTYIIPRGTADIFFPTDFSLLRHMHHSITGRSPFVRKCYKFMEDYAKSNWTVTKSGYRPLLDDFRNTSILTTLQFLTFQNES